MYYVCRYKQWNIDYHHFVLCFNWFDLVMISFPYVSFLFIITTAGCPATRNFVHCTIHPPSTNLRKISFSLRVRNLCARLMILCQVSPGGSGGLVTGSPVSLWPGPGWPEPGPWPPSPPDTGPRRPGPAADKYLSRPILQTHSIFWKHPRRADAHNMLTRE